MILYPNIFVVLIVAGFLGLLFYYSTLSSQETALPTGISHSPAGTVKSSRFKAVLRLLAALSLLVYGASLQPVLLQLGWVFFRMGALVFGNGFTMIPLIQQEVVTNYHWLTMDEFAAD